MKYYNVKLLSTFTSILVMVMFVPAAFGQATPSTHASDAFPLSPVTTNTLLQFQSVHSLPAATGATADFRATAIVAAYLPPGNPGGFSSPISPADDPDIPGTQDSCLTLTPDTAVGEKMWFLYHNSGAPLFTKTQVVSEHVDIGVNIDSTIWYDSIFPAVPAGVAALNPAAVAGDGFGSGSPATTGVSASPAGEAFIEPALADATDFYYWQRISGTGSLIPGDDDTGQEGTIVYINCVFIDADNDNVWDGTAGAAGTPGAAESRNVVSATVDIISLVGGESLPLSTTSLLVAGAQVNALWILPILGLAGTVLAIRKLEA